MKRALPLLVVLLLFAPAAQAGFFVGGSFLTAGLEVDASNFDEDDSGYKIWGGFHFNRFFGVEGGYYDLGNPGGNPGDPEPTAWAAYAKGKLPIGSHVELFAKAGYFLWEFDAGDTDQDGADVAFGAGVSVLLSKLELRAEWEVIEFDDEVDVDVVSVGAAWRF